MQLGSGFAMYLFLEEVCQTFAIRKLGLALFNCSLYLAFPSLSVNAYFCIPCGFYDLIIGTNSQV